MLLLVVIAVLALTLLWMHRPQRPVGFPPGPPTFLVFGNLSVLIQTVRGKFRPIIKSCRKEYGDIFGFIFPTGGNVVHLLKYEDIKDACAMQEFSGRPLSFPLLVRSYQEKLGIVFSEGPMWMEHRRFALRNLRDLGFGKQSLEQTVLDEFEVLAEEMVRDQDSPMKVNFRFNTVVLNILWRMVADKRLDASDPMAQKYIATVNEFFSAIGPTSPLNIASWLRHLFPEWSGYRALIRHRDTTTAMFSELVRDHQQTLDRASPRDFIDQFLIEMESPDAEVRHYTERNLAIIGMDFFIAGVETTSTSLTWALLLMVMYPDVQARVQREIDSTLGTSPPAYGDRNRMPYTEATLMEITRRATVLPLGVPHSVMSKTTFRGYVFPKDTTVITHIDAVHMAPEYWGDPEEFRPERFIGADGRVRHDERVIPFGVGKRFCLGETLARMEMFMLFTCLLQKFSFKAAPGQNLSLGYKVGVVRQPTEFFVTYEMRDHQ